MTGYVLLCTGREASDAIKHPHSVMHHGSVAVLVGDRVRDHKARGKIAREVGLLVGEETVRKGINIIY